MSAEIAMFPRHRSTAQQAGSVEADFEVWWELYPLKRAKGAARPAYAKARRLVSADMLIDGVIRYSGHLQATGSSFVCHPASWLNGERWEDEYETSAAEPELSPSERLERILRSKCDNMNRTGRKFPGITEADLRTAVQEGWLRKELVEKWR